jgi:hypothetical protein
MISNSVEKAYQTFKDIKECLDQQKQVDMSNEFNNYFKKILVLSAGSFFEHEVTQVLIEFAKEKSGDNTKLSSFVERQGIKVNIIHCLNGVLKMNQKSLQKTPTNSLSYLAMI